MEERMEWWQRPLIDGELFQFDIRVGIDLKEQFVHVWVEGTNPVTKELLGRVGMPFRSYTGVEAVAHLVRRTLQESMEEVVPPFP